MPKAKKAKIIEPKEVAWQGATTHKHRVGDEVKTLHGNGVIFNTGVYIHTDEKTRKNKKVCCYGIHLQDGERVVVMEHDLTLTNSE